MPMTFDATRGGMRALTIALALLGLAMAGGPAVAQAQTGDTPTVSADEVDEETLRSVAAAAVRIDEISQNWTGRLQEAEDEAEMAEIRERAQQEMVEAVRAEGISVEEYNVVLASAESDEELNAELQQFYQEAAGR